MALNASEIAKVGHMPQELESVPYQLKCACQVLEHIVIVVDCKSDVNNP